VSPPGNGPDFEVLVQRPGPGSHRVTISIGGGSVDTLADLPPMRNRLLFVGLMPTAESVETGHYHQDELGRRFWTNLIEAHILPAETPLDTADDALIAAGHGITDLLKRPGPDEVIPDAELTAGVGPLWQKIAIWRPAAIAFIYKRVAEIAAGRALDPAWGQLKGVALAGRPCFLMPAPDAPRTEVERGLNFLRNLGASLPYD
jgi:G:T/U-mismatch repair DNA glycosylase